MSSVHDENNFRLFKDCFDKYRKAHILFHTLSQQLPSEKDKEVLIHFRQLVEQRFFFLKDKGIAINPVYLSEHS